MTVATSCTCGARKARCQSLCPCCCDALTRAQQFERIAQRHQSRADHRVTTPTTMVPLPDGRRCLIDTSDREAIKGNFSVNGAGYVQVHRPGERRPGVPELLQGLIMRPGPGELVVFINHDKLDNRRRNLRVGPIAISRWNRRKGTKQMSSRFKGVYWSRDGRWCATITHHCKRTWLGSFGDEVEAARAYDRAALELFGDHAWINCDREEEAPPHEDARERARRRAPHENATDE